MMNRNPHIARIPCAIAIAGIVALAGCTTSQPIGNSLLDITGESRVTRLKGGPLKLFTLFEQHEAFSVNGLLPMPDVGQQFHFTGDGDPTSAIGIATTQSYKIIGESENASSNDVNAVRTSLDRVQFLTLRVATVDERINQLRAELRTLATNDQRVPSVSNLVVNLTGQLNTLTGEQATNRLDLRGAQDRLSESASKPGIVVARWQARDSGSGSAKAGSLASLSFEAGRGKSGFVVLGGVRFVALVYGEDLWALLNNLRPHEQKYVRDFGIVTYLIQASNVAYSASSDLIRKLDLKAESSLTNFSLPTSAEVLASLEQLAQFENFGNLGRITWKKEPYCFVCGIDLPDFQQERRDKVNQEHFHATDAWPRPTLSTNAPSSQGWRTVVAKVAHFGWGLSKRKWIFCGKRVWENYKHPRSMDGAPTCPICKSKTDVRINGYGRCHYPDSHPLSADSPAKEQNEKP